jgi:hypothetical protein
MSSKRVRKNVGGLHRMPQRKSRFLAGLFIFRRIWKALLLKILGKIKNILLKEEFI